MSDVTLASDYVKSNVTGAFTDRMATHNHGSPVVDMICLSRARNADLIAVSGPGGLDLLGALFRMGFEQVVCLPAAVPSFREPFGAILLAGHRDFEAVARTLRTLVPHLRDGGVLACELPTFEDDCRVETCVASLGSSINSTVFDLRNRVLVRHTVGHGARLLRAA